MVEEQRPQNVRLRSREPLVSAIDVENRRHPVLSRQKRIAETPPLVEPEQQNRWQGAEHVPRALAECLTRGAASVFLNDTVCEQREQEYRAAVIKQDGGS